MSSPVSRMVIYTCGAATALNTASQFFHIGSRLASPDSEDTAPEVYDLALSGSLLISGGADGVVRSFRARVDADEEEEDDEVLRSSLITTFIH